MKKILIAFTVILIFTQCSKKNIVHESTLELNEQLVLNSISLWKDVIRSNDSFTAGRVNQFNKDMSTFYQENVSSTTKELNPFYHNSITPYYYGNGKQSTSILKNLLEKKQVKITDSLSFNKALTFENENSKLMTSNITITLYKAEHDNHSTWFLGKINHNEFHKNTEGFSMPIFTYKYTIKNNRILSFLMCNINYEIKGDRNTFLMKLNEIDVINNKIEYEDFTKKHLDIQAKNLNRNNINVTYK
jgi:hypothetical protein